MPVQRLGEEGLVLRRGSRRSGAAPRARGTRAPRDRRAAARSARRARAAAGASSRPSAQPAVPPGLERRRAQSSSPPPPRRGPGKQTARSGSKLNSTFSARLQVGELAGLGQRDAKLAPRARFLQQHRGIRAVEQQALHLARVRAAAPRAAPPRLRPRLATSGRTKPSTASPDAQRALGDARESPSHPAVVSSTDAPRRRAVTRPTMRLLAPDEARDERRLRAVVQILRRAELLEAAAGS